MRYFIHESIEKTVHHRAIVFDDRRENSQNLYFAFLRIVGLIWLFCLYFFLTPVKLFEFLNIGENGLMSLILTTRQSLTKAVLASESFWNLGTPRLHLMRTITLAHSQDNIAFLSTNILNVLFPNFILLFYHTIYFFRIFDFLIISPVEDCSSGGRKLVFLYS